MSGGAASSNLHHRVVILLTCAVVVKMLNTSRQVKNVFFIGVVILNVSVVHLTDHNFLATDDV